MEDFRLAVAEAIRKLRERVQWKPGKDVGHLRKRKAMGHLPASAGLADYDALIQRIVHDPHARVFVYQVRELLYVVVRGDIEGRAWLTIFSLAGVMETAFPPDDPDAYLRQPGFAEIGTLGELLA